MGDIDAASHELGVLSGKVESLISLYSESSARHLDMHKGTHEKIDQLIAGFDGKIQAQEKRIAEIEHKLTYQRGVIAAIAVFASLVSSWFSKILHSIFS